ncbi:MAG TPA: crosslink repair DNA glycosylase YcaQ family protein [Candidatus Limnocylindrales bacterium]|nr:crosslink repair DNA glycosylase YcaQ family protein [Candidatus Limnocylindrales bacterium]
MAAASRSLRTLSLDRARRLAIRAQALDGSARSVLDVVRRSGVLQLDPTARVAPNHVLAVWSRLGRHDEKELRRLIARRVLVEYDAYIIPMRDLPLQVAMRRLMLESSATWMTRARSYLAANVRFVRYVLRELDRRGPLSSDTLEDRADVAWPPPPAKPSSGWNADRNRTMLLHLLQWQGRVLVSGRVGAKRLWDLSERVAPDIERVDPRQVTRLVAERRVRHYGLVRPGSLRTAYLAAPDLTGVGERVRVEGGVAGEWIASRDLLRDAEIPDRLTLLSPFDRLIHDRDRARDLFGFDFTMEIYVPKALRKYGFFVMPVLDGSRIVARLDPELDRASGTLRVNAVHPEPGARVRRTSLRASLGSLAETIGARRVVLP